MLLVPLALFAIAGCGEEPPETPYEPKPLGLLDQTGPEKYEGINQASILAVSPDPFDAGKVRDDTVVKTTFAIRNPTERAIQIRKMTPDCACTLAAPTFDGAKVTLPFSLPAGGTLKVPLEIDPSGRDGRFDTNVQVESDQHPRRPYTWLHVRMFVQAELTVEPVFLFFGLVPQGQAKTKEVVVKARHPGFQVTALTSSSPHATAKVIEHVPAKDGGVSRTRIAVTLDKEAPEGDFEALLHLDTNHPRHPRRKVTLKAVVQGPVVVNPGRLSFYHVKPGDRPARVLILRARTGNIDATKVSVEPEWIVVRTSKRDAAGREVSLTIEVGDPPAGTPNVVRGRVTVHTGRSDRPTVEVPLLVRFAER